MAKRHTKSNSAKVKERRRKSCITVPWLTAPGAGTRHPVSIKHPHGVDKTRNTEHAGTCPNIPEHPGTKKDKKDKNY